MNALNAIFKETQLDEEVETNSALVSDSNVKMEQGLVEEARKSYETATSLTPECVLRLQHTGALTFYAEDYDRAADLLQQAWNIGKRSRLFDVLSMLLIAFVRYEKRQTGALLIAHENIKTFAQRHPGSHRLHRRHPDGGLFRSNQDGSSYGARDLRRRDAAGF